MISSAQFERDLKLSEDPEKSFAQFQKKLLSLANEFPDLKKLDSFNETNINIVNALCNRLLDANDGSFYGADELKILIHAHELRQSDTKKIPSPEEFKKLRDAIKVKVKHDKYNDAVRELNATHAQNIFTVLKENNKLAVQKIESEWQLRKQFATLSSSDLMTIAENLQQLKTYVGMLKADFPLHGENNTAMRVKELIANLSQLIDNEEKKLAGAMLARLALVPKDHLEKLKNSSNSNETFNDDVVLSTLESLVLEGLKADYVKKFMRQAPSTATLTDPMIRKFNDFINTNGNEEQIKELINLYRPQETEKKVFSIEKDADQDESSIIFIPTNILNHFNGYIPVSDNALGESITIIEPEQNKLDESGLGISLYDLENNKRIYIPGSELTKVNCEDKDLETFYELVKAHKVPDIDQDIKEFELLLKPEDVSALDKKALQSFCVEKNRADFKQKVKDLIRDNGLDLEAAMQAAFTAIANALIAEEASKRYPNSEIDKLGFVTIANRLTESFQKSNEESHFEINVLNKTQGFIASIEARATVLANASKLDTELTNHFKNEAYNQLQNDTDVHTAIKNAESITKTRNAFADFLQKEYLRVSQSTFMMDKEKTDQKLHILKHYSEKLSKATDVQIINQLKNDLLADEKFKQGRNKFSLFALFGSKSKQNLEEFIKTHQSDVSLR